MTKNLKKDFTKSSVSKLKVGDAVKVIAGQWRGTLDHIHQIDHTQKRVYLQKTGLRSRFDRYAPPNKAGEKVREIRRGLDISNVAYVCEVGKGKDKKILATKIGFQTVKKPKGKTTEEVKVRLARKFKELID
ncbi:MAG: hypothetical protein I3273_07430 [Candidatus Moeniiplasma glomeromycotorum]|nr:hypothetical protein [Candidatus Moeniiplasma glomeromycotorum]MCE8164100.1 hypothetical protein [Candidatus Moeniiplasma glomeromycotorum]MCE8166060.1 hypothetical protein [Candidatus Moeniiplasma glomeromycotorum]MCE8168347.1 hypothetical protein [Candidatus Moeniiplasma glomeromycotorum]MCE8169918.1 hypothetical protein [Candidatus Moeniiplasma glomeromycotorum]